MSNSWVSWLLVFSLISLGSALIGGLDQAMHDSQPFLAFVGYWLSQAVFMFFPGAIVGGIVALAANRSPLGLKVMIIINSLLIVFIIFGTFVGGHN